MFKMINFPLSEMTDIFRQYPSDSIYRIFNKLYETYLNKRKNIINLRFSNKGKF